MISAGIGTIKATMPWFSADAGEDLYYLPQQEIDLCLQCPLCASSCDKCDGKGNLKAAIGRPKVKYDAALLREMLKLKKTNRETCAALNISLGTLHRLKNQILLEEEIS